MHADLRVLLDHIPILRDYPLIADLLTMVVLLVIFIGFVSVSALVLIWLERKISARMQMRTGPMLAVPWWKSNRNMWAGGLMQTSADAMKLMFKEDIVPRAVDPVVYKAAPFVVICTTFLALIVVPFTYGGFAVSNLNVGLLYLLAVSSLTVLSIMMAGWGSNNKYSLLGGLRAVAQMISYEVPMILALMAPVIMAGSLNLTDIVTAQQKIPYVGFIGWFAINCIAFVIYIICGTAETNRPPFDLVEGESELIAGFHTEYSGMRFAMFFLAEFVNMLIVCCVATVMFLGGWTTIPALDAAIPASILPLFGFVVFFIKVSLLILLFMWIRWTFPRLRADQLMGFGWKILLPASFAVMLWAALWTIVLVNTGVMS